MQCRKRRGRSAQQRCSANRPERRPFGTGRCRGPRTVGDAARHDADPVSAPHLSIVVLPFANIGGDPEQDYFVDGVTESLTTDLSRISGSFVIGRHTAFTYKGNSG